MRKYVLSDAEEEAVKGVIQRIWDVYDEDNSGILEKDEIKIFLIDSLKDLRLASDFSKEAFDEVFKGLD